jgi:hypothetical protein
MHQSKFSNNIVLIDPGLREHGGHHPALIISMLTCELLKNKDADLTVFANADFEPGSLFDSVSNSENFSVVPFFNVDYYHYFYLPSSHVEIPSFIKDLSQEYLAAMSVANNNQLSQEKCAVSYFFHGLGWEHASALADALYLLERQEKLNVKIVVLLMFSPYRHSEKTQYDHNLYLKYSIAFKRLSSFECISFFACDFESGKAYEHILGKKVEICPLPFIPQQHNKSYLGRASKQVILYLGDTKATKGFLSLPKIVRQIVETDESEHYSYLIQYTLTNKSREFLEVDFQLKELANYHSNIVVHEGFWSEHKLHQTLQSSAIVVFNYDSNVYQFQSSGVLWLAASFELKMIFLAENWLTREATRLNCDAVFCSTQNIFKSIQNIDSGDINKNKFRDTIRSDEHDEYMANLFGDFNQWLIRNLTFS